MFQSFCSRFFWGFWFANDYSLLGDRWMSFLNWRFGTSFISWVLLGAVEAVILIAPQKENGPPRFHANSKSGRWGSRPGFHVSFQRDKIHSDFYCNESWRLHDISWIWQQKLCERSNFVIFSSKHEGSRVSTWRTQGELLGVQILGLSHCGLTCEGHGGNWFCNPFGG